MWCRALYPRSGGKKEEINVFYRLFFLNGRIGIKKKIIKEVKNYEDVKKD